MHHEKIYLKRYISASSSMRKRQVFERSTDTNFKNFWIVAQNKNTGVEKPKMGIVLESASNIYFIAATLKRHFQFRYRDGGFSVTCHSSMTSWENGNW